MLPWGAGLGMGDEDSWVAQRRYFNKMVGVLLLYLARNCG